MKFLQHLSNLALFLILTLVSLVAAYEVASNGISSNLPNSTGNYIVEISGLIVEFVSFTSATFFLWKETNVKTNGFLFGIIFSSILGTLISIRILPILKAEIIGISNYTTSTFVLLTSSITLLIFLSSIKKISTQYRLLLFFWGKVLKKQELSEGITWLPFFLSGRLFDMTRQTLNLTKRGEDIPMFPNGTRLKEFELIFMYHLKPNNLHKLIYLGENWKYEIEVVINDSIPPALIALSNSITADELREKFFNSYSIALLSNSEMFKFVLFHGAFFASIKDFPDLVKNSFWKERACDAFDDDFMAQKGYFPKVISKQEKQLLVYLNKEGNEPHDKILRALFVKTSKEKIDYVIKNDLSVCVFDKFQENNLVSNGVSIHSLKGIFYKTLKLGIMPVSLNLLNIQATDDIKAQAHRNELENVQRKAELQSAQTHSMILKELKKYGIDDDLAVVLAAKIQGIEGLSTHEITKHKFEGNSDLSKVLAGLSALLSNQKGDK